MDEIRQAALAMAIEYHSRTNQALSPSHSQVVSTALIFEKYLRGRETDRSAVRVEDDHFPYDPDKKDFAFR